MLSCGRLFGAALALALTAVFYAALTTPHRNSNTATMPKDNNQRSPMSAMDKMVDYSKFELFSGSLAAKKVNHFVSEKVPISVPTVTYSGDDTIRDIVHKREPRVLLASRASQWGALHWDLWDLAKKLPLLMGVAATEDEATATVVLQHERDPGGMLTEQPGIPLAKITENMFFFNFLLAFKNAAVRMFYYGDFRIFQRMINVSHLYIR